MAKQPRQDFNSYFSSVYGERWPDLLAALQKKERQVLRLNRWAAPAPAQVEDEVDWLPGCYWLNHEKPERKDIAPSGTDQGLSPFYIMDPASVLAARALEVTPGERVLDMCAAPGGKSLILLEALEDMGELIANEISSGRRERLKKVIQQYVPRASRDHVFVQGKDGLRFGISQPGAFDRILLDAPCSGERHLLESPGELSTWSPKRSENLAKRQYGLLTSALLALKPGGTLLYSTCSISPLENDGVIERLLEKKSDQVELALPDDPPSPFAERTRFGWIHLPDRCGFGPLYFSRLSRV